jgi:threonine aldolase
MDGARIFNAAEYLKVPVSRVARDVDSVCFCLSKNLCCPVGSLLVGTKQFVDKARRLRKALGGGMRQVGFLAAAGLCALDTILPHLGSDHRRARQVAEAIDSLQSSIFKVDVKSLQTNILMVKIHDNPMKITSLVLGDRLAEVKANEIGDGVCDNDRKAIIVKTGCKNLTTLRIVLYHQIDDELTQLAIKKIAYVMRELELRAV